jgi:hypothetical protein
MPEYRPYMLLARYYDQFFSSHVPGYQRARRELLRDILPQVRSVCDLACGTGTTVIKTGKSLPNTGVPVVMWSCLKNS